MAEQVRAIDGNGHVPEVDEAPDDCTDECAECQRDRMQVAAGGMLAAVLQTQELVYQLAEQFGISRDELNARAGLENRASAA